MSSGSESDEDYMPGEPEKLSEEESADEETEELYEKEQEQRANKRRAAQKKSVKKSKIHNLAGERTTLLDKSDENHKNIDAPEEEKKREEELWAKFLEGTETKPLSKNEPITIKVKAEYKDNNAIVKSSKPLLESDKDRESRIFEFAGETIIVENNVIKEKVKSNDASSSVSKSIPQHSRGSGGLSSVLGQLNRKSQLSTLEKSKLDWDTYKKEEDIDDEIQTHNKGKKGYLDRQDFLERTDVRQYELEREIRMSRRSNR